MFEQNYQELHNPSHNLITDQVLETLRFSFKTLSQFSVDFIVLKTLKALVKLKFYSNYFFIEKTYFISAFLT